jgi:hypothetical protein
MRLTWPGGLRSPSSRTWTPLNAMTFLLPSVLVIRFSRCAGFSNWLLLKKSTSDRGSYSSAYRGWKATFSTTASTLAASLQASCVHSVGVRPVAADPVRPCACPPAAEPGHPESEPANARRPVRHWPGPLKPPPPRGVPRCRRGGGSCWSTCRGNGQHRGQAARRTDSCNSTQPPVWRVMFVAC